MIKLKKFQDGVYGGSTQPVVINPAFIESVDIRTGTYHGIDGCIITMHSGQKHHINDRLETVEQAIVAWRECHAS